MVLNIRTDDRQAAQLAGDEGYKQAQVGQSKIKNEWKEAGCMFNKLKWRHMRLFIGCLLVLAAGGASGCAWDNPLPPEEALNRAIAGLSGVDNLAFKGNAAIRSGEEGIFEQNLAFEGELKQHNQLILSSKTEKKQKLAHHDMPAARPWMASGHKVTLKRKQGQWSMLSPGHTEDMWMSRLNPLEQLEYVGRAEKRVADESGAARGTRVLRVELTAEAASRMTREALNEQMEAIGRRIEQKGDPLYSDNPSVRKQLKALWQKENDELAKLLQQAEVNAVYHVTINKRSQLPTRLTMERQLSLPDGAGGRRTETLVSDITFAEP